MQDQIRIGLNKKLLVIVLLVSALVVVPLATFQIYLEYVEQKKDLKFQTNSVVESYDSILAEGLYKLDEEQLKITLNVITNYEGIVKADIESENFDLKLSSKNRQHNIEFDYVIEKNLVHAEGGSPFLAGQLKLYATYKPVLKKLQERFPRIIGFLMIEVFLVSLIVMLAINWMIVRPVVNLSNQLASMKIDEYKPIEIQRLMSKETDEFTILTDVINDHAVSLQKSNKSLNEELNNRKENQARIIQLAQKAEVANIASSVLHNSANALMIATLVPKKITKQILEFRKNNRLPTHEEIGGKITEEEMQINKSKLIALLSFIESGLVRMDKSLMIARQLIRSQQSNANTEATKKEEGIKEIVTDILILQEDFLKQNRIKLIAAPPPDVKVHVIRFQLANVIINVIKNAAEAMQEASQAEPCIQIHYKETGSHLEVCIQDNGIGIDPDNIGTIEKGSFTTKKEGHGFGFSSCKRIMQTMGGDLSLESEGVGKGAIVHVSIPKSSAGKGSNNLDEVA